MELTQLRYFLQVYRLGNICSASARLNVTQQAVSKQIRKLEDELGVALFVRNPRGVQATAYADMLAQKVQGFLPELDALVSDIQKRDREISGVVRLGIQCWQMSVAHGLRYDVLKTFEQAYPRVRLIWENSIPGRCLSGLREGALDLAVMGVRENQEDLDLTPLRRTGWYMLMAQSHPLAAREVLHMNDLAGQRIILSGNEAKVRRKINSLLGELEKPEFIGVEDFIFDLIGQQIEGNGAMMLTTEITQDMFNPARFVMVPLTGSLWRTELYLARLKDMTPSPAAQALYQFLLEKWSDSSQPLVVSRGE